MTRTFSHIPMLAALVVLGCAPPPPGGVYYASGAGSVTPDGLRLVDWEPFRSTYVMPGADIDRYDKLLVEEVTVSYEAPPRPARSTLGNADPNYALSDSAMQMLKRCYREEFVSALGRSRNFSLTNSPGPRVLLISGRIIGLKITMPPVAEQAPDEHIITASSGRMALVVDARDSESGRSLVRVGQRRAIERRSGHAYESDTVGTTGAIRDMFRGWAHDLRRELDAFHSLPALPPAPPATR